MSIILISGGLGLITGFLVGYFLGAMLWPFITD
jgi:hypothetical protein